MARKIQKLKSRLIQQCILSGAGEIIIIDVDRDGTCKGLNFELIDYLLLLKNLLSLVEVLIPR